jgi:hypothetical protein
LNFTSGSVNIGSNNLAISGSGSITGAGSTSYVITGAGGTLSMSLTAGASAASYPVGTSINFAPATVQLNAGSASGTVDVGVAGNVLANGTTGADISTNQPVVDATWFVHSDITSNLNLNLGVAWSAAMEVNAFTNAAAYISHYTNGSWDVNATAAATAQGGGMFSLQKTNITSLSPFAVFNQNTSTNIFETTKTIEFEVYPNPASNHIIVKNNGVSTDALNVDVTNVIGQVVSSYKLTDNTLDIPLSELHKGSYFIRIYNNKINEVKKITKM